MLLWHRHRRRRCSGARFHDQDQTALPVTYRVDTPGGTVEVELTDHEAYLTGPAVLVAHGELALPDQRGPRD